jgi:hypothetical protein
VRVKQKLLCVYYINNNIISARMSVDVLSALREELNTRPTCVMLNTWELTKTKIWITQTKGNLNYYFHPCEIHGSVNFQEFGV